MAGDCCDREARYRARLEGDGFEPDLAQRMAARLAHARCAPALPADVEDLLADVERGEAARLALAPYAEAGC